MYQNKCLIVRLLQLIKLFSDEKDNSNTARTDIDMQKLRVIIVCMILLLLVLWLSDAFVLFFLRIYRLLGYSDVKMQIIILDQNLWCQLKIDEQYKSMFLMTSSAVIISGCSTATGFGLCERGIASSASSLPCELYCYQQISWI